ncbi:hypothetical protein ABPG74_000919 [Tetrahymena malaccensis]
MKLNSYTNKPNITLTQNLVFENEYFSYLKQISREEEEQNLMSQSNQPSLFKMKEISIIQNKYTKNYAWSIELRFPLKNGSDEIFNSLSKTDNQITELEKQLCLGDTKTNFENEELQNLRRYYFQDKQNEQLNRLVFSYPKSEQEINKPLIDDEISQLQTNLQRQGYFSLQNDQTQEISFQMFGNSLTELGDLVKLDQLLKAWKKQLSNIKIFQIDLTNLNKKTTLLSLFRYLISIKSNVVYIKENEYRTKNKKIAKQKGIKNSEVFEILDEAFQICLKNTNLQMLEINSFNSITFESFLSAMTNVNLTLSNICSLSLKIQNIDVEQQQLCTFFSCLNEFQYLQYLTLCNLNISEQETLNSLNSVLKKQKQVNLQIIYLTDSVDLTFNFEQAQHLNLEIDLVESQLTKKQQLNLFASISRAKQLKYIELNVYHDQGQYKEIVEEQQQSNNQKFNLKENKKIRGAGQKIDKINKQNKSKKPKQKAALDTENLKIEDFVIDDYDLLELFQDTPTQIEFYEANIKYNPMVLRILLLQIKNSQEIKNVGIYFKEQKYQQQFQCKKEEYNQNKENKSSKLVAQVEEIEIDFQDLSRNLKYCQKLDFFNLQHDCFKFQYSKIVKDMNLYSLKFQIMPKDSEHKQVLIFKNQFSFDFEKLKRVSITSPYHIDDLMIIDKVCQQLTNSPKVESIKLKFFDDYSTKICREKQNFDYGNIQFFNRLANLKYLENLDLDIPINQNILDSLSNFLITSQSLKCLTFCRNLYYYEHETDYTKFFQAMKKCKALQLIDLDLQIEKINIYQEVCLDTYEKLKLKLFYSPFSDFIQSTKNRISYVNYHEEILNKEALLMILSSLKNQKEIFYFQFEEKFLKKLCKENDLDKLLQKCIQKGQITNKNIFPYSIYFCDN